MFGLMGDVLMRSALLRELRQLEPNSSMVCYVDKAGEEVLLLSHDPLRAVRTVDRFTGGLSGLFEKLLLIWKFRRERFDLVLDLYNSPSSRRMLSFSGCGRRIWIKGGIVRTNFLSPEPVMMKEKSSHLNNLYFQMLSILWPAHTPKGFLPWVDAPSGSSGGPPTLRGNYLISLAAGDPRKYIPIPCASLIAEYLYREHQLVPVVARNPTLEILQEQFCESLKESGVPFDRLSLMSLSGILGTLEQLRFSILPDTGLFHLALGLRKPVLGVFTYTNPALVDPRVPWVEFIFKEASPKALDQHACPVGTADLTPSEVTLALQGFLSGRALV